MQAVRSIVLALCLPPALSGCMVSIMTYNKARGEYTWPSAPKDELPKLEPKPAYYALLPLTVPLDIATCPVQVPLFVMWLTMPEPEPSPFKDE